MGADRAPGEYPDTKFLSSTPEGYVFLWERDEKNGQQQWLVTANNSPTDTGLAGAFGSICGNAEDAAAAEEGVPLEDPKAPFDVALTWTFVMTWTLT